MCLNILRCVCTYIHIFGNRELYATLQVENNYPHFDKNIIKEEKSSEEDQRIYHGQSGEPKLICLVSKLMLFVQ